MHSLNLINMTSKNTQDFIEGYDILDLIENNHFNSLKSIEHLKNDNHWIHFINVCVFYGKITTVRLSEKFIEPKHMVLFHYLASSSINLMKGMTNLLGGHFTDSGIYLRRSIESVRHSIFIRENPEFAKTWLDPEQEKTFKKSYTDWIRKNGDGIVHNEFPYHKDHFDHASSFSAHPGHKLFSAQHEIETEGVNFTFRLNYSELTPNREGYIRLLGTYYWTIQIHFTCIEWWIKHSGIIVELNTDDMTAFKESSEELTIAYLKIRAAVKSEMSK